MRDLRAQIAAWRGRRLWLVGVGNPERSDDGFGVRLAKELQAGLPAVRVVEAGTSPERWVGLAVQAGCQELVFADAVDFGGTPGALLLAGTADLQARPVGTSTHRVPISLLAQYAEGLGARAWLLGVQPGSLAPGAALSPAVAGTLEALVQIFRGALGGRGSVAGVRAPATLGDGVVS
jgi:hydrogenase maturation protease